MRRPGDSGQKSLTTGRSQYCLLINYPPPPPTNKDENEGSTTLTDSVN